MSTQQIIQGLQDLVKFRLSGDQPSFDMIVGKIDVYKQSEIPQIQNVVENFVKVIKVADKDGYQMGKILAEAESALKKDYLLENVNKVRNRGDLRKDRNYLITKEEGLAQVTKK